MSDQEPIFCSLATIEEKTQERLSVKALADSVHFSKYHYQRLFREAVGDSVMRYVMRRRLSLAAAELVKTDATVLEIALRYGYDSHEGFTRSFKAHLGVTPTEYRKYCLSIASPKLPKEKCAMLYSKPADEMIRELNGLIVQARETAAYLKNSRQTASKEATCYAQLWDTLAGRADAMAVELSQVLQRITDIAQRPDEISARFMLIKAVENAAFLSNVTNFQAGLMAARAKPEQRAALQPFCRKYGLLAQNARIKAEKTAEFLQELAALIFQDMKKGARQRIESAAEAGLAAAKALSEHSELPYSYIAQELINLASEIGETPLEKLDVYQLENTLLRLDIIALAAGMDTLRAPEHQLLFSGIPAFKGQLLEALEFFQNLPDGAVQARTDTGNSAGLGGGAKKYEDMAFQGNILLFYLQGEIQKLGSLLNGCQQAALSAVCSELDRAIHLIRQAEDDKAAKEAAGIFQRVYAAIEGQAKKLGIYGGPIRFIAEEGKRCTKTLQALEQN